MRSFFRKRVILIVALAVFLALCLSVSAYVRGHSGNLISSSVNTVMGPLESGISMIADYLEGVYNYMYGYDALEEENARLQLRISELEQELRESDQALEEIDRLHALLGLQERNQDFEFESARVVSWGSSNWSSTFTISKGRNDGLELYDCVITETGYLVGQIVELSPGSAVVRTIIDLETSVGAAIERSSATGVALGDFELMTHGCLKLDYLTASAEILSGDVILTSGSDIFPRGLVIGSVIGVEHDAGGITNYAVISPSADLYSLSQVFIITNFDAAD